MKTIILIFVVLLNFSGFSQTQVKNFFGERYISPQEAKEVFKNMPDSVPLQFSERQLMNDFVSWLMPVMIKGRAKYILVKPNYLTDSLLSGYDTLDMVTAGKVAYLTHHKRPNFPLRSGDVSKFKNIFLTKENAPSKNGLKCKQTISFDVYGDHNFFVLALPVLMETGILESTPNSSGIWYAIEKRNKKKNLFMEILDKDKPEINETAVRVMTLTYLKK
jgi:hypothetical protein